MGMLGELLIYLESNQLRLRVGAVSRAKPYTRKAGTAQSESAQSAAQTRLVASLLERGVTLSNALDKEGKEVLKGGNGGKERIGQAIVRYKAQDYPTRSMTRRRTNSKEVRSAVSLCVAAKITRHSDKEIGASILQDAIRRGNRMHGLLGGQSSV